MSHKITMLVEVNHDHLDRSRETMNEFHKGNSKILPENATAYNVCLIATAIKDRLDKDGFEYDDIEYYYSHGSLIRGGEASHSISASSLASMLAETMDYVVTAFGGYGPDVHERNYNKLKDLLPKRVKITITENP